MSNKSFVITVLGMAGSAFVVVAALNLYVNPYAQYPTNFIEPLVQTSRAQKTELLATQESPPAGLLLGSSRVLKYEPAYLKERLGQSFFNAGVNYGKSEDYLAFLRFYENQFGCLPQTVIIGLDVHGFNDHLSTDSRLLNNRQLICSIPEAIPFSDRFQSLKELLSWQQTMSSLRSLRRASDEGGVEPPHESFRSDGMIVYHERERQIADGIYDFSSALDWNKREYKQLFSGYGKLSKRRIELFYKTLDACQKGGSRVVVFLTPMHPDLDEYLSETTTYHARRNELVELLTTQSLEDGFTFADLSDISTFEGVSNQFVDGIHPLEANTRRVIDRLFATPMEGSQYALQ